MKVHTSTLQLTLVRVRGLVGRVVLGIPVESDDKHVVILQGQLVPWLVGHLRFIQLTRNLKYIFLLNQIMKSNFFYIILQVTPGPASRVK